MALQGNAVGSGQMSAPEPPGVKTPGRGHGNHASRSRSLYRPACRQSSRVARNRRPRCSWSPRAAIVAAPSAVSAAQPLRSAEAACSQR